MNSRSLHTGQAIPGLGFGTWEITPDTAAQQAVTAALQTGYRLIDTARIYDNERGVGAAIHASGIPREELFITTKLWNDSQGYERTLKACKDSLERLGLEYLDLYLIHWPASQRRHDSWEAMEKLQKDGLIRAAGVSNYTVEHLEQLLQRSELRPAVNQVEFHPFIYDQQQPVLDFCKQQGIIVEAYSPVSRLSEPQAAEQVEPIAQKHSRSIQQVALRWCTQRGTIPIARSKTPDHIASNFDISDFTLDDEDMEHLDSVSDGQRVTWDPSGMGAEH